MEETKEVKEIKEVSAPEEKQEERKLEVVPSKKRPGKKKIIGIVGGVAAGIAAIGYGIYKVLSKKGESSEEDFEVIEYPSCEEAEDGDYTEVSD